MPNVLQDIRLPLPTFVRVHDEEAIEWGEDFRSGFREGPPPAGCLSEFIKLENASAERIARFAAKWGVLGFCEHGLPGAHAACAPELRSGVVRVNESAVETAIDPVRKWQELARRLRAFLNLGMALSEGKTGDGEDWQELFKSPSRQPFYSAASWDQSMFEQYLSVMLNDAGLTPTVRWKADQLVFQLELAGDLVRQPNDLEWPSLLDQQTNAAGESALFLERVRRLSRFKMWPRGSLYPVLIVQLVGALTSRRLMRCTQCGTPFDWQDTGRYNRLPRYDRAALCSSWCQRERRNDQTRERLRRRRASMKAQGEQQ